MKRLKEIIIVMVLFVCTAVLAIVEQNLADSLSTQTLVSRWSKEEPFAQISCFFSADAGFTESQIVPMEYQLRQKLQDESIDTTEENGRKLIDAYSSQGELSIRSDRTSTTVRAYGVGGDFFLFHPLTLLSGSYFNGADLNEDGVLLDESVAWTLFGSNNVAGLPVQIADATYIVRGVVRNESGLFSKAAGEEEPTIYVSYPILDRTTETELPIDCYELLISSPVKDFGTSVLIEQLSASMDVKNFEVVENSRRFDLWQRILLLKSFGIRSMNTKGIIYPYWENRVRGYEDIAALLTLFELICLLYPLWYLIRLVWKAIMKRDIAISFVKKKLGSIRLRK